MEIECAQCRRPFVVESTTRACPHCGSAKAATCGECDTAVYLGATTCVRHSEAGRSMYESPPTAGDPAPEAEGSPGPAADAPPYVSAWNAARSTQRAPAAWPPVGSAPAAPAAPPTPSAWPPPEFGAPAPAPRRRRRRWPAAVAALVLAGAAGGAALVLPGRGSPYPDKWDARITDLVSFVERERGLQFAHPVHVDFLADAEFRKLMTEREELTTEDKAELERVEAMLRAVGFLTGDVDLLSIGDELAGDGTVGVYDFDKKRISVRGTSLDNERRATLVHELTHALQDQHFDISDRETENSGEDAGFTAVVEADAELVQAAWVETLSEADRETLFEAEEDAAEGADFVGVPEVFIELMGAPYELGPVFLKAVMADRGQKGRDEVLRSPPTTEEHILLPATYLAKGPLAKVATPALAAGEKLLKDSEGDFGMLSLLVLLGERLDFSVAWPAVQGWAGDAVVAFDRGATTCVRLSVQFDEAAQAGRFQQAVAAWGQGLPTVTSSVADRSTQVESCDPGTGGPRRAEGHVSGLQGFGLRLALLGEFTGQGIPEGPSACIADGVLARFTADAFAAVDRQLVEGDTRAARELTRISEQEAVRCR